MAIFFVQPPPTGNDANPGTEALPFATITHGVNVMAGGDTLNVRAGTYNEALVQTIKSGISSSQPTVLQNFNGELVTLLPQFTTDTVIDIFNRNWIRVDGLNIDGNTPNGLFGLGTDPLSTGITYQNLFVKNCRGSGFIGGGNQILLHNLDAFNNGLTSGDHGIYFSGHDSIIRHCKAHGNFGYGIHHSLEAGGLVNNTIHNCVCWSNGSFGFIMNRGDNGLFYNNLSYRNTTGGFQIGQSNTQVYNNTAVNNTNLAWHITFDSGGTVRNNIAFLNQFDIPEGDLLSTFSNNMFGVNPSFVDQANDNYHLLSGSAARDVGFNLAGIVDIDLDSNARPQNSVWDIGAYEFVTSITFPHYANWRRRAS